MALIALALSIDNCAIAVAVGAQSVRHTIPTSIRLPIVFAAFASIAPAVGWLAGSRSAAFMSGYGSIVACAILIYVGWRTLRSAWRSASTDRDMPFSAILLLGLSTSADSLTVGFAMALAHVNILAMAVVNGAICGSMTLAGILTGEWLGGRFPSQGKIVAGIVLIAMGLHALAHQ